MSSQFCARIGKNIKKNRKEKDLTLKELADRIGLTEATVQKYEAGNIKKIDVEMLKKISDALGVQPENLTEWDKEEYQKYREVRQGTQEAKIIKMYSQLTFGHKKAVRSLMESLLECQERYSSDK
ncbi:MAG: helix-turn-helix transcriptional regulator [Lachnospiraceae bacterium]|nr:helix-turn-helix transcriptional regulator [Lachnospiraceae bacterium]